MPQLKLTVEDISFTTDPELDGLEMTEDEVVEINEKASQAGFFEDGVLAVLAARVTEDEDQEDEDERKVFVSIDLRVDAASEDDAEAMEPSSDLLDMVAAAFLPQDADAARENNWEVLSAGALDD